ncbi:MAG: hypothetical protein ABSA46_14835 [Thermodesulfovibrionales bacterium]|jgi:hypothetical protein
MDGFNSQFAQVLADRAWETVLKVLYGKADGYASRASTTTSWPLYMPNQPKRVFSFDPDKKAVTYRASARKQFSIPLVLEYRNDYGYQQFYLEQIIENIQKHDPMTSPISG